MKIIWNSFILFTTLFVSFTSHGEENQRPPRPQTWSFQSPFGTFDRAALQRGFQVFQEVCSACHGVKLLSYRHLEALGFSKEEIKALAAKYEVQDGPNDEGEMYQRPALPSDPIHFPYPNEKAARAANNGAVPPDLSLIVKAREGGPKYVYSLLTGYEAPPANVHVLDGMHYNPYFHGGQIAMAEPLHEGALTYGDGTSATVHQMAHDVVTFLSWAADPKMEDRKTMGIKVLIYLLVFIVLMFLRMRRVWGRLKSEVHH